MFGKNRAFVCTCVQFRKQTSYFVCIRINCVSFFFFNDSLSVIAICFDIEENLEKERIFPISEKVIHAHVCILSNNKRDYTENVITCQL